MKKILYYAKGNKKWMVMAIVCLFLSTIFGIMPYYFLNYIIVSLIESDFRFSVGLVLVIHIGVALLLKVILFGLGLGFSHIGAFNTLFNIRSMFARNMALHPMGHIMNEGTGKYKKSFVEDISSLESALAHMIPEGVPYICGVIITIVAIFVADYRLGLAIVIMIPLAMSPMGFMMKVGLKKMPKFFESRDVLNHTLVEYVSAMEVIKIFNRDSKLYDRLYRAVMDSCDFTLDWCYVTWKAMSVLYSMLPCTLLIPLPLGIYLLSINEISLGTLSLVIMLALSIGEPLIKLVNFMPSIPVLSYSINKVESVFVHQDVISGDFNDMSKSFDIEFDNVHFAYKDLEVIKGINLKIQENSICALVGPSGSGKSTLAKLLLHFWDIKEGSIRIGGRDIKEFSFNNLMNHISYVSQENTLFEGSVYDNLGFAKDGISKEEMVEACKSACCHDFIMKLEHGYDTNVGSLGSKLSGGERQRITIARAIIKNAPIVVLDEATAFADAENEFLIQEALSRLLIGKTVIIIAHKLHTIVDADKIAVINDGNIEMCDKHDVLIDKSNTYKILWDQNQKSISWDLGGRTNV